MTASRDRVSAEEESADGAVAGPSSRSADSRARALKRQLSSVASIGRRHWLFLFLLLAGAALRGVTFFAYRPALIFYDSTWYLGKMVDLEPGSLRPSGYPALLRVLPVEHTLAVVPFVQHLFGLLIALLIYATLVRLGVRTWLAALAAAPVLLDAYQLNIEQYVLSDTFFQLFVVAGCTLLLWRRPLGIVPAGLAGLLFAGATLTRSIGLVVIVPAILTVLFLRVRPSVALALIALFAIPLAAYATWFHSAHRVYALNGWGGRVLYARVAPFADCNQFSVPSYEKVLCPEQPPGERPTERQFVWSKTLSPVYRLEAPPGKRHLPLWLARSQVAGDFAKRVILHQPLDYARAVGSDFARGFAPVKTSRPGDSPVRNWRFRLTYPPFRAETNEAIGARADRDLASFLRKYQRYGYAPGPLLAAGLVVGLLAALGLGRARGSGFRSAAFLFSSLGLLLSLAPAAVLDFSWRYQLPQLVLLPPALALGLTALARPTETSEPVRDSPSASPAPTPESGAGGGSISKPAPQ